MLSFNKFTDKAKKMGTKAADAVNRIGEPGSAEKFAPKENESYADQMKRKKNGSGVMGKLRTKAQDFAKKHDMDR